MGMAFNRLIDEAIDAKNPRTASRPLQTGEISRGVVEAAAFGALFLFFAAVYQIHGMLFFFSPFVATLIISYSYMKRWTPACHFVLGLVQFCGPLLTFIAAHGSVTLPAALFSGALATLITGNDILYSTLDVEFDREEGLHSIPVRFGVKKAVNIAIATHIGTILFLIGFGFAWGVSFLYYVALLLIAGMLQMTHSAFRKRSDLVERIFALSNSYIGFIVLIGALLERIWHVS
jgi:4-hydroxybenzoate polyprenyltransferase